MQYTRNSEQRDTEVFEMLSLHTANFFFANLIESFDIHKATVIIGIHVLEKEIDTSIRTRNF